MQSQPEQQQPQQPHEHGPPERQLRRGTKNEGNPTASAGTRGARRPPPLPLLLLNAKKVQLLTFWIGWLRIIHFGRGTTPRIESGDSELMMPNWNPRMSSSSSVKRFDTAPKCTWALATLLCLCQFLTLAKRLLLCQFLRPLTTLAKRTVGRFRLLCHCETTPFAPLWIIIILCLALCCRGVGCSSSSANASSSSSSGGGGGGGEDADEDTVHLQVVENRPAGSAVGRIPTKPGFTYRFSDPPHEFTLNATSGYILTAGVLDRESLRSDRFDLVVLSSQPTYPVEVRIRVLDVNDNAPTFPEASGIRVSFSESASPGTRVILDTANDSDLGNNSAVEYAIVAGNDEGRFQLVVVTHPSGETPYLHLETVASLDRETRDAYRLNISARDGGKPPLSGFLAVNVTVLDVNDNPPIFDHSDYAVSLNESVPPGTGVLRVHATDADQGPNARVAYYLSEVDTQFTVDAENGEISTQETLNCPKHCPAESGGPCTRSCVFTVFARDHGAPRQDGRAYVTVNLVDANDNDPRISFRYNPPSASFGTVDENAQNGTIVAAVSVVDPDDGPSGETEVRIIAGNELKHFRLERNHDVDIIRVNSALDRERINEYNLTVVAVDGGSPPRSATAFLMVVVNDVNDHAPVFERSDYAAVLSELAPTGSYVASVVASDDDTGINSRVFYDIAMGNADGWFRIDAASGLVTTAAPLDRERRATVSLNISARDGGPNPRWAYATLNVRILDENDESPTFNASNVRINVPENSPSEMLIVTLSAKDDDLGVNGTVVYSLSEDTNPQTAAHVLLDTRSGRLQTTTMPFDREKMSAHVLQIIASDGGRPARSSTIQLTINIQDENDNDPVFYPAFYFHEVESDLVPGTVVATLQAHDPDEGTNSQLTFTLHGDKARHFHIRSNRVETASSLAWGDASHLQLTVSARDGGDRKSPKDAVVLLMKKRSRTLQFHQPLGYNFHTTEDKNAKSHWPRPVGEVGVNEGNVKYAILAGDQVGMFSISETSGVIVSTKLIDREQQSFYTLTVLARAENPTSFVTATVNITVLDLNDNAPMFAFPSVTVHVKENLPVGYELYLAKAVDADVNATTAYRLSHNSDDIFAIDSAAGMISLNKIVDYEKVQQLAVTVVATDVGEPSFSSAMNITFLVDDVNDHTPTFDHLSYETSLSESTPVNTRFHAFQAIDKDSGANGWVSYRVVEAEGAPFAIFPDGSLYVSASLDRETRDYYELTVLATDHGSPTPRSASVAAVIRVLDENDNTPRFQAAAFNLSVPENEEAGAYVGQLRASDADAGRNAELSYAFAGDQRDFAVDERSGVVRTARCFDRERNRVFVLDAAVADHGLARRRAEARVSVLVTDVNDNAPRFSKARYEASVSEGAPARSHVARVSATDADEGDNGRIQYNIRSGDEDGSFRMDPQSGRITLAKPLDRERVERYSLTVVATDNGQPPLSSTTVVHVIVLDENDNAPRFEPPSPSTADVAEDAPIGWTVAAFAAADADAGANGRVRFSLASSVHEAFRVDPSTGVITVDKPLDREQKAAYKLNVSATDDGSPRLAVYTTLQVRVLDVNDNAPSLLRTPATRKVREGIAVGTVVFNATADDPDEGDNGRVSFSLGPQRPPGAHFAVDPGTGVVVAARDIDREAAAAFQLTLVASDNAWPEETRLTAERRVTVFVEDVNDNAPVFVSPATAVIEEAAGKGHVITTLSAIDADAHENGQVTYELVATHPPHARGTFSVDRHSGNLYLNGPLATQSSSLFNLSVRASDGAPPPRRKHTDTSVTLLRLPSASSLSFRRALYEAAVAENETAGAEVVTVQLEAGAQRRPTRFFVASVEAAAGEARPPQRRPFTLDPWSGKMTTAAVLDRDTAAARYKVVVVGLDDAVKPPMVGSATVVVTVLDKNDSPPVFPSDNFELEASELSSPGTLLTTLSASDPDETGTLTYSLLKSQDSGPLTIDSSTGALSLRAGLDRERAAQHVVHVVASDGVHESTCRVRVKVLDANDNAPQFGRRVYAFDVREDASRGESVGRLKATDADTGINARLRYSLLADGGSDAFVLDAGVITLQGKLDYEQAPLHVLVVSATDGGSPSLSATVTVYVNVLDANDNAPLFDPVSYSNRLPEDVPIGTTVLAVTATDQDDGENGHIKYELEPDDDAEDFHMTVEGNLLTRRLLDRERRPSYRLTVVAVDSAYPSERRLRSTAHVHVALTDVNDNAPKFVTSNLTEVAENMPPDTVVVAVRATDADEGINGEIQYSLLSLRPEGAPPPFAIGPVDGLLKTTASLDREKVANYTVVVSAKDRGMPARESRLRLTVLVGDENDNSPRFEHRRYSASVAENASLGSSVSKVQAMDADADHNGRVRYKIVAGDPNRDFAVGEFSGAVRIAKPLDYESQATYVLSVRAEDGGHNARHDTATVTVAVNDVNDNPPTFADSPYVVNVMENAPAPSLLTILKAHDADAAPDGQNPRYFLKDGDRSMFSVDAATGRVSARTSLNRERQDAHQITVIAVDSGTPRLTGTGTIKITVMDVNDNSPVFDKEHYLLEVKENQPPDRPVVQIRAADADIGINAKIMYSLLKDDFSDLFRMDSKSGWLSTRIILDYEKHSNYLLTVMAVDQSPTHPRTATTLVEVIVQDINDNPPVFEKDNYSVEVSLPVIRGQFLFGCTAVDVDSGPNGHVFYELSGQGAEKFEVDSHSGVVRALSNISSVSSFTLTVTANDGGQPALRANATVKLQLRSKGNIPVIQNATSHIQILESVKYSTITTISIPSTKPRAVYSYSIVGGNIDSVFTINNITGEVNVTSGLDFETIPFYQLWIEGKGDSSPSILFPLNITLIDVNDNNPRFKRNIYNISLMEEEPPPQSVTVVEATDADSGSNGKFSYQLRIQGNEDSVFSVDAHSGRISTHSKLDREAMGVYTLTVEAVDKGLPSNTGSATIIVTVLDKNDNPPRFTRLFSANITENAAVGTFVIQVTSSDRDVGINANAVYSFTENPGLKFHIDPRSGNVTVAAEIDREEAEEYILKVSAVDGSWQAETPLTITVQDVNDNKPEFTNGTYVFMFPELQQAVSFVGTVSAVDKDKGGPNSYVSYSLRQSSDFFDIEATSGDIYTKKTMHYKRGTNAEFYSLENQFMLQVVATDHGKPPMSSECHVIVHVIGANEHAPVFNQTEYFSPVPTSIEVGDPVLRVNAIDEMDIGVNAKVQYRITKGNGSAYIGIDSSTGWLHLHSPLNVSENQSLMLVVQASDSGIPPRHANTLVNLIITGENKFSPTFSSSNYQVIIPENEDINTEIFRVTASDNDPGINGKISFYITGGNEEGCFQINNSTGIVTIFNELDYEKTQEYQLQITARDKAFNSTSAFALLTVVVTDINDNSPVFNQSSYEVTVQENLPPDIVVCRVFANDSDSGRNAAIQYSISGGEGKSDFAIDLQSGMLVTKISFDYEKKQVYFLEITASNPDTVQYSSCTVTVKIQGENEFYPRFVRSMYQFAVSATANIGTKVGIVSASDQDEGPDGLVYYLLFGTNGNGAFTIDSQTGVISISGNLRSEKTSQVALTALAKNKGPVHGNDTDEAQVIITIRKRNNAPTFSQPFYEVGISEDASIGAKLLSVAILSKHNEKITFIYSIVSGNEENIFRMEADTGTIAVSRSLDHETSPSFNLTVGAFENDFSPPIATATVMIKVHDVNDNGPVLQSDNLIGSVSENKPSGTVVMTLKATDPDSPNFGPPFSFMLNNSSKLAPFFDIDGETGTITTKVPLDREKHVQHLINVKISDAGNPPMSSNYVIRIDVLDMNDNPSSPRTADVIVHAISEMNYVGRIANVHPLDPDIENQFQCELVDGNGRDVFMISKSCDLHARHIQNNTNAMLNVSGRDGVHQAVTSKFRISISTFPNNMLGQLVNLRVINLFAEHFVSQYYYNFLKVLHEVFENTKHRPVLFAVANGINHTDLLVGAFTEQNKNVPKKEINSILNIGKNRIKKLFQMNEFIVDYESCRDVSCLNGGQCKGQTIVEESFASIDTPNLIFTSPLIRYEYQCHCPPAFGGLHCNSQLDPCHPDPCPSGSACIRHENSFRCMCSTTVGDKCELSCAFNPCKNDGTCQESSNTGVTCVCQFGFTGIHCETSLIKSCYPNPCENGGTCMSTKSSISCTCKTGFFGSRCQHSPPIGFDDASYAAFHIPGSIIQELNVVFVSSKTNGLIIRQLATRRQKQFFSLDLFNGQLELSVGASEKPSTRLSIKQTLRVGRWYKASVMFIDKMITLSLSQCLDQGLVCDECPSHDPQCHTETVFPTGPYSIDTEMLYVGGLPQAEGSLFLPPMNFPRDPSPTLDHDFVGCIQRIMINRRHIDLTHPTVSTGLTSSCVVTKHSSECNNDSCLCDNGLRAKDCSEAFQVFSISDGTFITLELKQPSSALHRSVPLSSWPTSQVGLSLRFRSIQLNANLLHSTNHDGSTTLIMQEGMLVYSSRNGFSTPLNITLNEVSVSDGQWHNVSLLKIGDSIIVSVDDVSKMANSSKIHNFLDHTTRKINIGGFTDHSSIKRNDLPTTLEGCISTLVVNGHVQPLEGDGSIFQLTVHGKLRRGCAGAIQSQDAAPTDPLSVGVTLVIVFFVVLMVAILVSFIVYRHRRLKRDKLEGHIGGSHTKANGGPLLPNGSLEGSRHQHDTTYIDNPDMQGDGEGLHGHLALHDVATKKHKEFNEIPQRPDIIEREMVNKSPIVSSSPSHDDGRKLGGLLSSELGVHDSEAPEHYDLENASSIAPSDIDIVYHYKSYRDGNVRKYKANNPHPPNFHHAHKHAPHVAYAPSSVQRNSPHSLLRHSPGTTLPPVARDSPGALKMQSTPLARLSPSSELSQQTPRILTLQDISGRPLQSALLATAPPGGVKDALANSERSLHSPISQLSRSTTSHGSTHGVSVSTTGPTNNVAGSNTDAKGLTADDIERLNARPRNSSLVSTLDAVSSSSSSSRDQPTRNVPASHQLAELLETNTELLEGADDSSSDESGNDSFTCSEFEYDNNYERASREFDSGNMIFSKLAEVDNENDEESTKNFDSFDSFHGSLSTLVASDDDDCNGSNTSNYKPTNGAHLGWDYLLNWGPNFESLVGVFKDLAELPDALRAKTQCPKSDEEYL